MLTTVALIEAIAPFGAVAVTEYVPATLTEMLAVVSPVLHR
ncbi:hypothetical protein GCM10027577_41010 [Spirosoma fluminis]